MHVTLNIVSQFFFIKRIYIYNYSDDRKTHFAFKIIKVKRFNAVTEETRESEDSMQIPAQDARRLSFAARRNKPEMETLSEEKKKIKERKKRDVFIPFAYSCYGVAAIRQNFS